MYFRSASSLGLALFIISCAQPMDGVSTSGSGESGEVVGLVSSYTTGSVSSTQTIRVRFEEAHPNVDANDLISFSPSIKGNAEWDGRTLLFTPEKSMKRGSAYTATVNLKKIGAKAPFVFNFNVVSQGYTTSNDIELKGKPRLGQPIVIRGNIITTDKEDDAKVEKMLSLEGAKTTVAWEHQDQKVHSFTLSGLTRAEEDKSVKLIIDGESIGVERQSQNDIKLPGVATFTVLSAKAVQRGSRHILITLSDDTDEKQDLEGLITVGKSKLRIERNNNTIKVYAKKKFPLKTTLKIDAALKNAAGYPLKKSESYELTFSRLKPKVEFAGKGSIVPSSDGLVIPVETSNLKSLRVEAIEVKSKNIPQFLQVNSIDGKRELQRVGRIIWRKTISLGDEDSLRDSTTRHGLDLSELIKEHPNSMVRLQLSFSQDDILYQCETDPNKLRPAKNMRPEQEPSWDEASESSNWDSYGGYSYSSMNRGRDNPCHPAYYNSYFHDVKKARNFLLSDIGMIAKQEKSGKHVVFVTDLKTSEPLSGAQVSLYDFQQTLLAKGRTNSQGKVELKTKRKSFLLVTEHKNARGYLRLDRGEALSTAHFDTAGVATDKGLKALVYGERGVWRPGDDVHLTFLLQDREKTLPKEHPIHLHFKDPRGKTVSQEVRSGTKNGFATFTLQTAEDAPTGNYSAIFSVGGASFTKVLKIETVVPNRLKVEFSSDIKRLQNKSDVEGKLFSEWLHGAKAKNLKAKVEVSLAASRTRFERYAAYSFDDPTRRARPFKKTIFNEKLDAEGNADVDFKLDYSGRPAGMMNATFTSRVFEPSGAFSIDQNTIPFSPYDAYVGIKPPKGDKARGMLLTDTPQKVDMVLVDKDGKGIDGDVRMRLYKINWRWWWAKGTESLADYAGSKRYRALKDENVSVKGGKASWNFEIKYPQWGRYLLLAEDAEGKHRAGKIVYIDWPGWAGRAQKDNPGGASVLNLVSDKQKVNVGDTFTVTIPGAVKGRALLTLENGSSVVESRWVTVDKKSKQVEIKATSDMAPNVYVHVSLLQPHMQTSNDLPMRLYGITPIEVKDASTQLYPVVTAPDEIKPNQKSKISVSEKNGKAMSYTLAVVDEGLLGLTRYKTPNPWAVFYAREALGIRTWDVYDEVAGAFGGKLETLLAIGGDGSGKGDSKRRTNRFPPMVHFEGPYFLKAGQTRSHDVPIGAYVGRVRAMVVAADEGKAFGKGDKEIFVRSPLMVQATLPRLARPGEEIALPVSVFSFDENAKEVNVSVETDGLAQVVSEKTQALTFKDIGDKTIDFKLKLKEAVGTTRIKVTATSKNKTATHVVTLGVSRPGHRVAKSEALTLAPGESLDRKSVAAVGMPGSAKMSLTVSTMPSMNLERNLERLVGYPHGCAEQTTSRAFPQVYLPKLAALSDADEQAVQTHVNAAIEKLQGYQNLNGGFGYWSVSSQNDDWATSYIGHFLLEAKSAGYVVPSATIRHFVDYQSEMARVHRGASRDLNQAYRLYTLALAERPDTASMNRLREQSTLSNAARARLAAAYALIGQGETAKALTAKVKESFTKKIENEGSYNSPVRDQAMMLEAFVITGEKERARALATSLSKALQSPERLNTQAMAYGLVAMARYARSTSAQGITARYSVAAQGEREIKSDKRIVVEDLSALMKNNSLNGLKFKNVGENTLFLEINRSGLPAFGKEESVATGLKINMSVSADTSGRQRPIDTTADIEQGTDLVVEYTVKSTDRYVANIALSSVMPAGFEIRNERLFAGAPRSAAYDYQDIRDASVETYFSLQKGESRTFRVRVNAAYAGRFYWPGAHAEAMYDDTLMAHRAGHFVNVVAK